MTKQVLAIDSIFVLQQCLECGLIYTFPQERIKIEAVNSKKYNSKEDERSYLGIYDQIHKRAQDYVQNIQKFKKKGKYLDIGCSYGIYLKAAKDAGFDTYGVEMAPNAANYAREKLQLNVFIGTLEKAKYKPSMFDVITLYDVLEHIPDLKTFLKEIYRILKPGGILIIQCPNIKSFAFTVLDKDWNWLLVPNHLWHFSNISLTNILKDYKFSVKKTITWDSPQDFASNWVTKIGLTLSNASFLRRLIRKFVYLLLYEGISIGSLIWSSYYKGGSQIIYVTKN